MSVHVFPKVRTITDHDEIGAITVTFLLYTIAGIVWQEDIVKEVFVVPIAALFAFPAVRSNLPGAPQGFGSFIGDSRVESRD